MLFGCAVVIYAIFVIRPWAQESAAGWELLVQIAAVLTAGLALFALFVPGRPESQGSRQEQVRDRVREQPDPLTPPGARRPSGRTTRRAR